MGARRFVLIIMVLVIDVLVGIAANNVDNTFNKLPSMFNSHVKALGKRVCQ